MTKKVLHIIDNMWLWWAQTLVKGLSEYKDSDVKFFLYSLRKQKNINYVNSLNFYENDSKNKFSFPLLKLRKFIIYNNIEILHCHLAKSQILWWILKKMFFPNIKLIFHEHWEIFENWKLYPFLMNYFKKEVDLYIAVSNLTKNKILEKTKFSISKVKVLYNFVDTNRFYKIENLDKNNLFWKDLEWKFIIWFAARLIKRKWWERIIELAHILNKTYKNIFFVIAWDWPDKKELIYKINDLSNIKLLWHVSDMNKFYNSIDLFIFPSIWEPLWLTWIESNSCWCPVIASNIEWINEILINEKNSLLFDLNIKDDLLKKVLLLYNNKELRLKIIEWWFIWIKNYTLDSYILSLNYIYGRM